MKKKYGIKIFLSVLLQVASSFVFSCNTDTSSGSPSQDGTASSSANVQAVTCPSTADAEVAISGLNFAPADVSISTNSIVKWTNNDNIVHTVTSGVSGVQDNEFNSGNLNANSAVCYQFLVSGTYQYFCKIHPGMTGTITVN